MATAGLLQNTARLVSKLLHVMESPNRATVAVVRLLQSIQFVGHVRAFFKQPSNSFLSMLQPRFPAFDTNPKHALPLCVNTKQNLKAFPPARRKTRKAPRFRPCVRSRSSRSNVSRSKRSSCKAFRPAWITGLHRSARGALVKKLWDGPFCRLNAG